MIKKFGLIGYPLGHSFSKKYYQDKIASESIQNIEYDLYPIPTIQQFEKIIAEKSSNSRFFGFNVTIPYKKDVISYLDEISAEANEIGAVNCIQIKYDKQGIPVLKGYNTDAFGFQESLLPQLDQEIHTKALILGNGGAANAVKYVLKQLNIDYKIVSRTKAPDTITYHELTDNLVREHKLIVNCSPVGTFPNIDHCPEIPYEAVTSSHYLYDLIYNPEETLFLKKARAMGAATKNGHEMLILQADKNWEIWGI